VRRAPCWTLDGPAREQRLRFRLDDPFNAREAVHDRNFFGWTWLCCGFDRGLIERPKWVEKQTDENFARPPSS
jgi:hypothetical protein